jgi:hypothetical protein
MRVRQDTLIDKKQRSLQAAWVALRVTKEPSTERKDRGQEVGERAAGDSER